MLRTVLRGVVLAPLVVALISCGGGGDDEPERHEVPGLIAITQPSPGFSTTSDTATLRGSRSSTVHTVRWSNSAGGNGSATLGSCTFFPVPLPLPCWQASILLNFGANVITVIGDGDDGEFGQATTTITRN
jgi:hypothetical protein